MDRSGVMKKTEELKKLIAEHPDYPIVVLAGDEANSGGGYYWMYCTDIRFDVGEILDAEYFDDDDSIITDRDQLEEIVEERLYDTGLEGEELEKAVKAKVAELEPYWTDVIAIYATN